MLMGRVRLAESFSVRLLCRALLLVGVVCVQTGAAQQTAPMSPSVVLVLKLVSNTLVKPTTGIVVSKDGLVLVPAAFAAEEGEMIVLDGGTDIASNGRPAKLMADASSGELAILSVKGLKRPGIGLSGNWMETGGSLHLEAFPPAEEIAKGAPPLNTPVKLSPGAQPGQFVLAPETPLPYVTGAILDECGYLAGVSLASGPQSLETGRATSTLFGADLSGQLVAMQLGLSSADCVYQAPKAVAPVVTTAEPPKADDAETTSEPAAELDLGIMESDASGTAAIAPAEAPPQVAPNATAELEAVTRPAEPAGIWRHVPGWLWILSVIVLGVAVWKTVYFLRLFNHTPANSGRPDAIRSVQPASDEPDTAPLENTADGPAFRPRSAPLTGFELPETAERPEGCDGLLLVKGMLDADTPFKRFAFVDTGQIDIVIGRGDADIAIEHAAISRSHARVRSDGERLTISDLGSRNGSFIGDVPCLAGEVMYLGADTEVFLGDVKITLAVVKQEAQWA